MIERGQDVLGGDGAFDDAAGVFVGLADDPAASHAATREDAAVSLRPVVPAAAANVLKLRRSAMLAHAQNQRLVQQAASVKIVDKTVKGFVQSGQQLVLHAWIMVPMGVPSGTRQAVLVPEDADESGAGLDQSPG